MNPLGIVVGWKDWSHRSSMNPEDREAIEALAEKHGMAAMWEDLFTSVPGVDLAVLPKASVAG